MHAQRRPVEQVHPALDDVPGAVDGLVRRRRPPAASQAEISGKRKEEGKSFVTDLIIFFPGSDLVIKTLVSDTIRSSYS